MTAQELTKGQRRYLSRRMCAWCEQRLDRDSCGSCFGAESDGICTPATRAERRARCLAEYQPRARASSDAGGRG